MSIFERRNKARKLAWEVVDVDLAEVYHAANPEERDAFREAVELVNHRVIVKEVMI